MHLDTSGWVGLQRVRVLAPHQASVDTTLVPTAPQTLAGQSNSTSQLYLVGERKKKCLSKHS